MKRTGSLIEPIAAFENLLEASNKARRGKRNRADVADFHFNLEENLFDLRRQILEETYEPGEYRCFKITDPKPRLISAAPYRDRVVHHAVCQIIEPLFERSFIFDSYANRTGKGSHRALDRCTHFARRRRFVLKCDVEKYFPSMDHMILKAKIERTIKCAPTLRLLGRIIDSSNPQEDVSQFFPGDDLFTAASRRRGLPIGNLTSQLFGNVYLSGFDHFVKEELRFSWYIRFVDDFLLFADYAATLQAAVAGLQGYFDTLRLKLHPTKCQIMPTRCGVPFLGWTVFPDHRRLRRATGIRIQRRLGYLAEAIACGQYCEKTVRGSLASYEGHLRHGDTSGLREKLFSHPAFSRYR